MLDLKDFFQDFPFTDSYVILNSNCCSCYHGVQKDKESLDENLNKEGGDIDKKRHELLEELCRILSPENRLSNNEKKVVYQLNYECDDCKKNGSPSQRICELIYQNNPPKVLKTFLKRHSLIQLIIKSVIKRWKYIL